MEVTRIPIHHFDCAKQKIEVVNSAFVELSPDYFRHHINAYIRQWDDDINMLSEEPTYICNDDVFPYESFSGVCLNASTSEWFIVRIYFVGFESHIWVRFDKESSAREFMNKIMEWRGFPLL